MALLPQKTHGRVWLAAAIAVVAAGGFVWAQRSSDSQTSIFSNLAAMVRLPPVDPEDQLESLPESQAEPPPPDSINVLPDPSLPQNLVDSEESEPIQTPDKSTPDGNLPALLQPPANDLAERANDPDLTFENGAGEGSTNVPAEPPSNPSMQPPPPEVTSVGTGPDLPTRDNFPAVTPFTQPAINFDAPPWWNDRLAMNLFDPRKTRPVALQELLLSALYNSQYVRAISLEPLILETEIVRNAAAFDPGAFIDSKWQDLNDPVGNTLTTGGANRFNDHDLQNRLGMRRKIMSGAVIEAGQEVGLKDTNSIFFQPSNQSLTRMYVSYNQPLLRGYGQCYNEGLIVLAEIDTRAGTREVEALLADHLQKVIDTYWELCLNRAWFLQRVRARDKGLAIQRELEGRRDFDVLASQLLRAQAAVAIRTASLARAEAGIRNAETRLRTLTNAPELSVIPDLEILPVVPLPHQFTPPNTVAELQTALSHRAEIERSIEQIRGGEVRLGMAGNELKPNLNLLIEGYAKGLRGNYDVGQSLAAQFVEGSPSYTTGLTFEAPLGNRAAISKYRRRELEVRQLMHQFQDTLQTVSGEVEIAIRNIEASYREIVGQRRAVAATEAEVNYLLERWRLLPGHDRAAAVILEDALNAQDRLVAAEATLAQAQHDFAVSLAGLKRANGTLLNLQPGSALNHAQEIRRPDASRNLPPNPLLAPPFETLPPPRTMGPPQDKSAGNSIVQPNIGGLPGMPANYGPPQRPANVITRLPAIQDEVPR